MYDFRNEIVALAEKALQGFVRFRLSDMGIGATWKVGLKRFVEREYPLHEANYKKLFVFLQSHNEQEVVLEQLDITSLVSLVHYYWKSQGIYDVSPEASQLFINHVLGIRDLRNTFEHYTKELIEADSSKMFYDQLYFAEGLSSFAVLIMKYKSPTDEWKSIYHKARQLITRLHGERWLSLDDKEKVLQADDDMSAILSWADQGNIDAQIKAGKAYYYGDRAQFDQEKAYMWFYKAAKRKSPEAEFYIGLCHEKAYGVEFNYETAMSWFKKSAEHGFAAAQFRYGSRNWAKIDITAEEKAELFYWIELAANQEYPEAIWALSLCYSIGYGVTKNKSLGKQLKEKSAKMGYFLASKTLGQEEEKAGNLEAALEWYLLASRQGSPDHEKISMEKIIMRLKRKIEKKERLS